VLIVGKIGHVEERVPFETEVDEGGLHARENAGDAPLMDAAGEGILVGPLEENLYKDIVLKYGHLGFVAVGRND